MKKIDSKTLDKLLYAVNKPYQYMGHELYSYNKDFIAADVRFAIAFPDKYEVGASNLGHRIIYETLNLIDGCMCDRAYAPDSDCKKEIERQGLFLYGVESKVCLADFDLLGFSLQYELAYPTVLAMLKLSGIPVRSNDRNETHPIILAGGPCTYSPEPLKDFIDGFLIGDGEDILKEIVDVYKNAKNNAKSRLEIIKELSHIDGLYVPSVHKGEKINKRIYDFSVESVPTKPPVPFSTSIHDRAVTEIRRGCGRMCRFCQPGHVNLPIRERKAQDIIQITKKLVQNTGYDEFSLLSLSSNDYTLNSLLNLLPKKIYIHLIDQQIDEFINTLQLIFENRVSICLNCEICNLYRYHKKTLTKK